jgi:hypothetical protein
MQQKRLIKWLEFCFTEIKQHWPVKVHGFGVNSMEIWKRFPFYSVDATSWLMGGKFRRLIKFKNGKLVAFNKRSSEKNYEVYKCHQSEYQDLNRQNTIEYIKAAQYVTNLWRSRGVKW